MFLLQMSGVPGSGKTTLALWIAEKTKAFVLDHDVIKSALLQSGVEHRISGKAAYEVAYQMAENYLAQGRDVILDSPCFHQPQVDRGMEIASRFSADYKYIECFLDDIEEIDRRLKTRIRMESQLPSVYTERTSADDFLNWARHMKKPPSDFLVLDATRPAEEQQCQVTAYLKL